MQETRALVNDNLLNKLTFYILYFLARAHFKTTTLSQAY